MAFSDFADRGLAASLVAGSTLFLQAPSGLAQGPPTIIYERPGARANSIDFSLDGVYLATAGLFDGNPYANGQVRFWSARDGVLLQEITLNGTLGYGNEVRFSPAADRVATANGAVDCHPNGGCFAVRPGQFVWSFSQGQMLAGSATSAIVAAVDYSPRGKLIATAEYYTSQAVKIYDANFNLLRTLPGHPGGSYAVRFSPAGNLLASGGEDSTVKIWRVADGTLLATLEAPSSADSVSLDFSPDGAFVAVGYFGDDVTLRVYRVEDGQLLYSIPADPYSSRSTAAFTPDGQYFAGATTTYSGALGWHGLIRFWCLSSGKLVKEYLDNRVWDAGIGGFAIAPDDTVFAYGYAGRLILARRPVLPACD
jgi:WD40 repeat protein